MAHIDSNDDSFEPNFINIKTFDELIEYNLKFLNGDISYTFYHGGPVDSETIPLLDNLKLINRYGFVSTGGQPSLCTKPEFISKTWQYNGETYGNWWVKLQQKSYICGYIEDTKKNKKLINFLFKHKKIYTTVSKNNGWFISNLPKNPKLYNLTKSSTSKISPDEGWSEWTYETNTQNKYNFEDYDDVPIINECIQVEIVVKHYCKDSVEDVLLEYYTANISGGRSIKQSKHKNTKRKKRKTKKSKY